MMSGYINTNREAILQIAILGDNKKLKSIKAVIDTGFTGDLTLPQSTIDDLGFILRGFQKVTLGDGSTQYFDMYVGSVIWDGQVRQVEIHVAETDSLIGMGLLEEYKLEINVRPGSAVKITSLTDIDA